MKKVVLLINLGTPDSCDAAAVKSFLKEFLNDKRVVDLAPAMRWLLVNRFIVPLRYKKTAAAYQKIWREEGSPLFIYTEALAQKLANLLGEDYHVEFAMRYGSYSIPETIEKIIAMHPHSIQIVPLFPQYAAATTGSALAQCYKTLASQWQMPALKVIDAFYNEPGFIRAYAQMIQQHIRYKSIDMLLFSYHGLPLRHIKKSRCQAMCDANEAYLVDSHTNCCYRAQCFATSSLLAKTLGLEPHQYSVSFQSRLGRTPWIKPYTDLLLPKLIKQGVRHIAIVCPSFVSDCLETLEEVNIRMREQWQQLGGVDFTFIPCINDSPAWVQGLRDMLE